MKQNRLTVSLLILISFICGFMANSYITKIGLEECLNTTPQVNNELACLSDFLKSDTE